MNRNPLAAGLTWFAPRKIAAVYVLIGLVLIFSVKDPTNFANLGTAKIILNQYAVSGLISLALLLPLAAGTYDLSIGNVAGVAGIATAYTLANISTSILVAIAVGLLTALLAGLVNCLIVIVLGIDSFIGTLATGSIFAAATTAISGDNTIATNVNGPFQQKVSLTSVGGLTLPVFITLAVALVLFVVLEKSAFGRRTYAIGFDQEVARLGGVRVGAVRAAGLIASALLSGTGGIIATAQIGAGTPATGPNFLLPAFAAAFLGATQFRPGRVNAWGTILAIVLLGTGDVGLVIVGAPVWAPSVFTGVVLIAAVGLTSMRLTGLPGALQRRIAGSRGEDPAPPPPESPVPAGSGRGSS